MPSKKVYYDGYVFDSEKEFERYQTLRVLERIGEIRDLEVHPKIDLTPCFKHRSFADRVWQGGWEADFRYVQLVAPRCTVVEDYKGYVYRSFKDILPYILYALRDVEVFINPDVNGWYTGEESNAWLLRRKRKTVTARRKRKRK